jgi:hypothetical protein
MQIKQQMIILNLKERKMTVNRDFFNSFIVSNTCTIHVMLHKDRSGTNFSFEEFDHTFIVRSIVKDLKRRIRFHSSQKSRNFQINILYFDHIATE